MGNSLIPLPQQGPLNSVFNDIHATFGRPVAIFRTAKETVISTNNSHNFLFQDAPTNSTVQEIVQSGVFLARILYGRRQDMKPVGGVSTQQPMIELAEGEVRLKLDPTGAAFLAGAQRATVDGNILKVTTDPRPHGLIGLPNFTTFYFRRLD